MAWSSFVFHGTSLLYSEAIEVFIHGMIRRRQEGDGAALNYLNIWLQHWWTQAVRTSEPPRAGVHLLISTDLQKESEPRYSLSAEWEKDAEEDRDSDNSEHYSELRWLWITLTSAWERLAYPATRRDVVIAYCNVQRVHRTIRAYLTWFMELFGPNSESKPSREDLMGAFTTDLSIAAKLMKIGCPVWHMRRPTTFTEEHVVVRWVNPVRPPDALKDPGVFSGNALWSFQTRTKLHSFLHCWSNLTM